MLAAVRIFAMVIGALAATSLAALPPKPPAGSVRVAAVQSYSRMGALKHNRTLLTKLITQAAGRGAQIVVLPECAVHGYMDPGRDWTWTSGKAALGEMPVAEVAEPIPGPSTRHFAALAKKRGIYLVVPLIEAADGCFHNAQVLVGPKGKLLLHHRKHSLWPPGDAGWATAGKRPVQAVDTPFGRLGLMICYDVHDLPAKLKEARVDIVLYSVGWYGPNTKGWYEDIFPRRYVVPNGFAVVAANWSADPGAPGWEGIGYSCVIARDGKVLAMATATRGEEIVLADLPLGPTQERPEAAHLRTAREQAARRYPPNVRPIAIDNDFARQNPRYKERAGRFYEKQYLGKAVDQVVEHAGLSGEQRPAAHAILRAFIYDWLDATVRGGGAMPRAHLDRAFAAMDERFQGELDDAQYRKYLKWRKSQGGARNALGFLMKSPPPAE